MEANVLPQNFSGISLSMIDGRNRDFCVILFETKTSLNSSTMAVRIVDKNCAMMKPCRIICYHIYETQNFMYAAKAMKLKLVKESATISHRKGERDEKVFMFGRSSVMKKLLIFRSILSVSMFYQII